MATTYCTEAQVKAFLSGGTNFPTSESTNAINRAEARIDKYTQRAWGDRTVTVTDEYYDLNLPYECSTGRPIYLNHMFIKTLASGTDKIEVWNGSSYDEWLSDASRTEGRANDYWADESQGVLYIRAAIPFHRRKAIRMTYRYGETTVPDDIERACILLAAIDIVTSTDRSLTLAEGGTTVTPGNKIQQWKEEAFSILDTYKVVRKWSF